MSNLLFRRSSIDDIIQLRNLAIVSYSEFEKVLPPDGWQTLNKNLHDTQRLTDIITRARIFVCETDETIVGVAYLMLSGNPSDIYPAHWSYIRMVGVHPAYRGNGIGRQLTAMCVDQAIEKGEKTIGLHTSEVMDAARHIYESMGFNIFREIEPLYGVRYWVYKKDL